MADPPITQVVREGNPIEELRQAQHEVSQDLSIAELDAAMRDIVKWAGVVTETINRELTPAAANAREMLNSRHGSFQVIDDSFVTELTVAELTTEANIEFLWCENCHRNGVYLPPVTEHPGPLYIWTNRAITFYPNPDTDDLIDQGASSTTNEVGGVLAFNDAVSNWYFLKGVF